MFLLFCLLTMWDAFQKFKLYFFKLIIASISVKEFKKIQLENIVFIPSGLDFFKKCTIIGLDFLKKY
jgi:hypothetical protein